VRVAAGAAEDGLQPATVDQVVKGYLVAGRRRRAGQRGEAAA